MPKERLNVYMKPETREQIRLLAERLGMSQTRVAALAVEAGINALKMSLDPSFQKFFDGVEINGLETNRRSGSKSPDEA